MKLKTPCIVVNFKTYPQSIGAKAVTLARICEGVARKTNTSIGVCVSSYDLYRVSSSVKIPVFGQHVDSSDLGAHTGSLSTQHLKLVKGDGSLLNHSERRLTLPEITSSLKKLKNAKLQSLICAPTVALTKKVALLRPDFVGVEPPELIGGDISVSSAKPSLISRSVKAVGKNSKLLVGAGIKNAEDVRVARALGAHGVLVASGVVKARNPKKALLDLVSGLKK